MKKSMVILALVCMVGVFFAFDLGRFLELQELKRHQETLLGLRSRHPFGAAALYFAVYVAVTALSLPGATLMTLIGGAIFGLFWGTLLVSFASTTGATLAFLTSRYLMKDWVQERFGERLGPINRGIEKNGPFFLFSVRLVPAFPFFLVNVLMGLTPLRVATYAWVSQLGMLPGTVVYVNAGRELGSLNSLSGILSPGLIAAFVALATLPWLARFFLSRLEAARVYRGWSKPARFDRNLIVIGAGSGGLVTSYIAAAVRARVTLIEKHKMGGDCLNTGCVPSKALIRSAKLAAELQKAGHFGIEVGDCRVNFPKVMERVQTVVQEVEPHDSVERYTSLGVECIQGTARIVTPWSVEVQTSDGPQTLTAKSIVIAAGARPIVPPIPGLQEAGYLTSDTLWQIRELPRRLLVLGGGPIGCELAQCFTRLGSQVTIVDLGSRVLGREDEDVSRRVTASFERDGVRILSSHKVREVVVDNDCKRLICDGPDGEVSIEFDSLLCAVGRRANVEGYGLEELGVDLSPSQTIAVDEFLQTRFPNILACGDVAGPYQFTHTAAHQAWFAAVNALFGGFKKFAVDYSAIPWCTFTDPEVARVGLNEQEARAKGIAYEVATYDLADLDRAIADSSAEGMVKVLTPPGKDRILGVTIVGAHAGDLLAEYVLAMRHGLGLNKILSTIHIYPTLAEANKFAAGEWKKAHKPERLLRWLERFHRWQRGG